MVWGAIRGDGHRVLVRYDRNVYSKEYQRILSVALPHIYEPGHAFQHDGAPAHRSSSTTKFLTEQSVQVLRSWPAQSPDLSVIENIWEYLKNKVLQRNPRSHEDLCGCGKWLWRSGTKSHGRGFDPTIYQSQGECLLV